MFLTNFAVICGKNLAMGYLKIYGTITICLAFAVPAIHVHLIGLVATIAVGLMAWKMNFLLSIVAFVLHIVLLIILTNMGLYLALLQLLIETLKFVGIIDGSPNIWNFFNAIKSIF
ncbi:MAG: hypothetical protein MHMPM18_004336 [Marteilia pararefringens]